MSYEPIPSIRSVLLGALLVAVAFLLVLSLLSVARAEHNPEPVPGYYVCGTLAYSGMHICTVAPVSQQHIAVVKASWEARAQWRTILVFPDKDSVVLFLAQGPRCSWQHGGNCA